jgi:hypothetical protein
MTALAHHMPGVAIPVAGTVEKKEDKKDFRYLSLFHQMADCSRTLVALSNNLFFQERRGTAAGWKG